MKILKVKIQRNKSAAKTSYVYPLEYNPLKIQVIAYETMSDDGVSDGELREGSNFHDGQSFEYMIGYVKDADAAAFLASPDIVEIDRAEAEIIGARWIKPVQKITDQDAILTVLAKAALDQPLTADDKKVLDPNDPTAGVVMTKDITQILDDISAKSVAMGESALK